MGLPCGRRTWSTVSNEAIAVGALGEGVIALQFARTGRDIVDNPMVEAPGNRCIIVGHEQDEALRPCRHIHPVQLRGDIGAGTPPVD